MANFHYRQIEGPWVAGYCLDFHTLSSEYVGDNDRGIPQYKTVRTEVGELLYELKYRANMAVLTELVQDATRFLRAWNPEDTGPGSPHQAGAFQASSISR